MPNRLLNSLCGGDSECIERVLSFLSYLDKLEHRVKELPKPELKSHTPPLIKQVKNLDALESEARRIADGDEDAIIYLVRRRVFLEHGRNIQRGWRDATCPVCGLFPTLILYKQSETGLFSGHTPYYRCVCGAEWLGWDWRCPRCGEDSREMFENFVLASSSLETRRCGRCGYVTPVMEYKPLDIHKLHLLLVLLFL